MIPLKYPGQPINAWSDNVDKAVRYLMNQFGWGGNYTIKIVSISQMTAWAKVGETTVQEIGKPETQEKSYELTVRAGLLNQPISFIRSTLGHEYEHFRQFWRDTPKTFKDDSLKEYKREILAYKWEIDNAPNTGLSKEKQIKAIDSANAAMGKLEKSTGIYKRSSKDPKYRKTLQYELAKYRMIMYGMLKVKNRLQSEEKE